MMKYVVDAERRPLLNALRKALAKGVEETFRRRPDPEEPDYVAGLVMVAVPDLYHAWKNILRPYQIRLSMASVYCHQRPKVTYNNRNDSCELGDLLIVHFHRDVAGFVTRNALLYQAKLSTNMPHRLGSKDQYQLGLYEKWPKYKYKYKPLSPLENEVTPNCAHKGAQYLLINENGISFPSHRGSSIFVSCMPAGTLYSHASLQVELIDFLEMLTGRSFNPKVRNGRDIDGWSQTVWDLLESSIGIGFSRSKAGYNRSPRVGIGTESVMDFVQCGFESDVDLLNISNWFEEDNSGDEPPINPSDANVADESTGVPIIIVRTVETEPYEMKFR